MVGVIIPFILIDHSCKIKEGNFTPIKIFTLETFARMVFLHQDIYMY